jgi:hypothetical protein
VSGEKRTESPAEELLREQREEVAIETTAMSIAYNHLQPLSYNARRRALDWLTRALETPNDPPF